MEVNQIQNKVLYPRLDMVFDQAKFRDLNLREDEIAEYADFSMKNSLIIEKFIEELKKGKYLNFCCPDQSLLHQIYEYGIDIRDLSSRTELFVGEIVKFEFDCVKITNWSKGAPNKIYDQYVLYLKTDDEISGYYELTAKDIIQLKTKGAVIEFNGDILGISVEKVLNELNNYYKF